ncbi:MAG: L-histidine N(alpha)-methyltransferase [Gemmatimonadota bacterium]
MPEPGPAAPGPGASGGADRIRLRNRLGGSETPLDLARDVRAGLTASPKTLPPKYFYDARGSRLFEAITELPEYYQTRTEKAILRRCAADVVEELGPRVLVEFGSGSASKTRVLLDAMRDAGLLRGYGPVDVSADASRRAAGALAEDYPELTVEGVIGDFEHAHELPFPGERRLLVFLGSTIGNLNPEDAVGFLRATAEAMSVGDGFLIGFDLVKDPRILERAYNDAAGVTADFNLNLLRVLNRELEADFDLERFRHLAFFNEADARIEMHLESKSDQVVRIEALDLRVPFEAGETIRTELSHKYTRESVERILSGAGLRLSRWETDPDGLFALGLALRA